MRKLFKKALACCLVAALALTCFVGALSVSAETYTGTLNVATIEVAADATEAIVPVTIESANALNAAKITVAASEGWEVSAIAIDVASTAAKIEPENINGDTFIVEAVDNIAGFTTATVNVTFTSKAAVAATITATLDPVHAATWNEDVVNLAVTDGAITVKAAEPECDHADATSVVTTRPTKDTEGTRTYTCACGETWTETIPVATIVVYDGTTAMDMYKLGHNLDLKSSIEIAFRLRAGFVNDAVSAYAVFEKDIFDAQGNVVDTDVFVTDEFATDGNRKVINYNRVKSTEMGTVVRADFYRELADGTFECVEDTYAIKDYTVSALAGNNAALKTVVIDLMNYGAAAQVNFKYNTANLVNAEFSAYADLATKEIPAYEGCADRIDNANKEIRLGRALDLASAITIIAELKTPGGTKYTAIDDITAKYSYTDAAGVLQEGNLNEFPVNDLSGNYEIYFDKLTVLDFATPVTLSVYRGDTLISDTIVYSVESYASSAFTAYPETDPMYNLMACILKYAASAKVALG